ncbi:hypothetical protein NUW54_g3458 [Trametes sanguinea]|uniref:Uncharacterized protein n=1 Tax=Trametes sanguinea TaxID=158606 RepID=A0ACC1Q3U6_9APHY|nr:hypothetical protein NUW54_g3458 [Trametes sanguinea]
MAYALEATIQVPSAVSALSFSPQEVLCVGSDDGSVRWYDLPSTKVSKAIKSLEDEVSSIIWTQPKKDHPASIWITSGPKVFAFATESKKIIMSTTDASCCLVVGFCGQKFTADMSSISQLSISENGKLLAFGTDSGSVGTIEISTQKVSRMRASHTTVCGSVKFIPDRPSEMLSGGYDSALLHFDISQGNILSRLDITAPPPTQGVSLSPPFVLSISLSPLGLLAASTADGRVWLGGGGEKRPNPSQGNKKKRSRKWEGLKEDEGLWVQVADGPVVSTVFRDAERLLTCSLLGSIAEFKISRDSSGMLQAEKTWSSSTSSMEKVNAIAASQFRLVIGGFGKDGKGVVEPGAGRAFTCKVLTVRLLSENKFPDYLHHTTEYGAIVSTEFGGMLWLRRPRQCDADYYWSPVGFESEHELRCNAKHVDPGEPCARAPRELIKEGVIPAQRTTIGDEKEWNPFMRLDSPPIQKATGGGDPASVMDALRTLKNNFRG